jgi:hypothetical protein
MLTVLAKQIHRLNVLSDTQTCRAKLSLSVGVSLVHSLPSSLLVVAKMWNSMKEEKVSSARGDQGGALGACWSSNATLMTFSLDLRTEAEQSGRSINLALSVRGIAALNATGAADQVKKLMIPMYGRMLHDLKGHQKSVQYGVFGEVLWRGYLFFMLVAHHLVLYDFWCARLRLSTLLIVENSMSIC